jgi:hypothetical protein
MSHKKHYVVKIGTCYNFCKSIESIEFSCAAQGVSFPKVEEFEEYDSFKEALQAVLRKNGIDASVLDDIDFDNWNDSIDPQ